MRFAGDMASVAGDSGVVAFRQQGSGGVLHAGETGKGRQDIQGDKVQVDDGRAGRRGEVVA